MVTDVMDETEVSLLGKFIKYPTIAYAQGAYIKMTLQLLKLAMN